MTALERAADQPDGGLRRRPVRKQRREPVARTVTRRDVEGTDLGPVDLEPSIFGIEPNLAVLHQVVTAQLAAARAGTQSTRTRAQVRGGGAKPFRQKGTGRARQGSTRSPQWVGGGVALGPKPRSYRQRTPKKMVRLALCSALSDRAAEGRVALVDRWPWESPRTKSALAALEALQLGGRLLVVLGAGHEVAERSFANLPDVHTIVAGELAAYDVLRADWVVFDDDTLPARPRPDGVVVDEVVIEEVDDETGDVTVEIIEEVVDTATGEALLAVAEVTVDEATGETVAEVTEALVDADGDVLVLSEDEDTGEAGEPDA